MSRSFVAILRSFVFGFVILASFILISLCAHVTHATTQIRPFSEFATLGIATSVLAILTLPAMLIIDNLRRGAVSSMILVEIVWLDILWILFLATAGNATTGSNGLCLLMDFGPIEGNHFEHNVSSICSEYKAIQAFAYMSWLAIFIYISVLSTLTIKLVNRGYNRVWYQSVRETDFNISSDKVTPMSMPTQQYIPPV